MSIVTEARDIQIAKLKPMSDSAGKRFVGSVPISSENGVWSYLQAKADARDTNTAFTNLRGRVTVVNAAIYSEPLALPGTTHRTPHIVLEHERGHILCRCVDEHRADEFLGAD